MFHNEKNFLSHLESMRLGRLSKSSDALLCAPTLTACNFILRGTQSREKCQMTKLLPWKTLRAENEEEEEEEEEEEKEEEEAKVQNLAVKKVVNLGLISSIIFHS